MSDVSDRLNGWKEIAAFLGKGVRTVQRWEHDYALPIHRVGPEGEIIFAYRPEIDAWVRTGMGRTNAAHSESTAPPDPLVPSTEPTSDAPTAARAVSPPIVASVDARPGVGVEVPRVAPATARRRAISTRATAMGFAAIVAAMAAVGYLRSSHAASGSGPASWRVSDRTLSIADGAGTTLWSHQFPIELTGLKRDDANFPAGARRVLMTDLDGDGRNEVLASVRSDEHRDESALYVFNADGSLRFRYAPSASRVFGDETFAGPWFPYRLFVLSDARGRPSIWAAFIHGMWYPSVLVELSGEGQVLGEYWSAGYIERVVATHWRGQPVVLVGGTNNESRGASLAVFPRTGIAGVSPAENPRYRCQSCPAGGPMEFLVFPRRCVSIRAEVQATVLDLWRDDLDRLHVLVVDGAVHTGSTAATAWYVLGADLAVTASYTPSFETFHRELERTGLLDHVFGPRDTAGLFPVLRWVNQHFEALASPARTN